MRCPKCGYISFDRVERCGKCANELAMVAAQLQGPTSKVAPPLFLRQLLAQAEDAGEAETAVIELTEEEIDLSEMELAEEPAIEVAAEEAAEPAAAEEVEGIEMPSLGGLDVSDLLQTPAVEEEAAPAVPEVYGPAMADAQAEEDGIDVSLGEASPAAQEEAPADEQVRPALDLDLTPPGEVAPEEESVDETEEGVVDLSDLMGLEETTLPADEEESAVELEDLALDLELPAPAAEEAAAKEDPSLSLEEPEPAAPAVQTSSGGELELDLSLDSGDAPLGSAEEEPKPPDIPDLGLTLEGDDEKTSGQ